MSLCLILVSWMVALVTAPAAANPEAETGVAQRPNVLFIALDDLNDWVGCLGGHPQAKTPNLDRLAASGVLFTNAHCAAPACNPSRTAIFTGLSPHLSGMYSNGQKMRRGAAGCGAAAEIFLAARILVSGARGRCSTTSSMRRRGTNTTRPRRARIRFRRTSIGGKRPKSLPRGGPWQYVETDWHAFDVTDDEFGGDSKVADWVSAQLGEQRDRPFFLACGIYRPHEPWFVPKKYFDLFPLEEVQLPPGYKEDDLDDLPAAGKRAGPNRYFAHIREARAVEAWGAGLPRVDRVCRCDARAGARCAREQPEP